MTVCQKCKEADMFTNHLISDALWWWLCIFPSALQRHRAGGLDNCVTQGMVLVMTEMIKYPTDLAAPAMWEPARVFHTLYNLFLLELNFFIYCVICNCVLQQLAKCGSQCWTAPKWPHYDDAWRLTWQFVNALLSSKFHLRVLDCGNCPDNDPPLRVAPQQ